MTLERRGLALLGSLARSNPGCGGACVPRPPRGGGNIRKID